MSTEIQLGGRDLGFNQIQISVFGVPGRSDGHPIAPPTDPDVTDSVIRFLGNQSVGTTLAHNFAALQT